MNVEVTGAVPLRLCESRTVEHTQGTAGTLHLRLKKYFRSDSLILFRFNYSHSFIASRTSHLSPLRSLIVFFSPSNTEIQERTWRHADRPRTVLGSRNAKRPTEKSSLGPSGSGEFQKFVWDLSSGSLKSSRNLVSKSPTLSFEVRTMR